MRTPGSPNCFRSRGPARNDRPTVALALAAIMAAGVLTSGCAPYRFGVGSLYRPDIRTVYVPMIEADTYRRNLGERLTEAVVKEIESRTTYKVVASPNADSVLNCRILLVDKRLVIENALDEPREMDASFTVDVHWVKHGQVIGQAVIPVPSETIKVWQNTPFVPEIGQSIATAQQEAIDKLAAQIVDLMEVEWGREEPPGSVAPAW